MKKLIEATSEFGNFTWKLSTEVTEEQLVLLAIAGLTQVAQRTPSSTAEKLMAARLNLWGGSDKRPKGFQRNTIPYSETDAKVLAGQLESLVIGKDDKDQEIVINTIVEVVEYVPGSVDVKYTVEKAKINEKGGNEEKLTALAEAVGFEFEDVSTLTAENIGFCQAIRKYIREQQAKLMAAV